jgi:hypothetical protein
MNKQKQKRQPTRAAKYGTHAKNASATKAGPGRFHQSGHEKASPVPDKGAPRGLVIHHASAEKKARRAAIKAYGPRGFKRRQRAINAAVEA